MGHKSHTSQMEALKTNLYDLFDLLSFSGRKSTGLGVKNQKIVERK